MSVVCVGNLLLFCPFTVNCNQIKGERRKELQFMAWSSVSTEEKEREKKKERKKGRVRRKEDERRVRGMRKGTKKEGRKDSGRNLLSDGISPFSVSVSFFLFSFLSLSHSLNIEFFHLLSTPRRGTKIQFPFHIYPTKWMQSHLASFYFLLLTFSIFFLDTHLSSSLSSSSSSLSDTLSHFLSDH